MAELLIWKSQGKDDGLLLKNGQFSIGRKSTDILVSHGSVSKRHAILDIQDDSINYTKLTEATTSVNGALITSKEVPVKIKCGDVFLFGNQKEPFCILKKPIPVICFSSIKKARKKELQDIAKAKGTQISDQWNSSCTHLVIPEVAVNLKTVQALLDGKFIVNLDWLDALVLSDVKLGIVHYPNETKYLPPKSKIVESEPDNVFRPVPERNFLLSGKTIIVFDQEYHDQLKKLIPSAGGKLVLRRQSSTSETFHDALTSLKQFINGQENPLLVSPGEASNSFLTIFVSACKSLDLFQKLQLNDLVLYLFTMNRKYAHIGEGFVKRVNTEVGSQSQLRNEICLNSQMMMDEGGQEIQRPSREKTPVLEDSPHSFNAGPSTSAIDFFDSLIDGALPAQPSQIKKPCQSQPTSQYRDSSTYDLHSQINNTQQNSQMPSQKKVTLADSLGIESQVVSSSLENISKRRKLEEQQEDGLHKKEDWSKVSEKQKMMEEMLDMEVDFLPSQKKVKRATKKDEVKLSTAVSELRKSTMAVNENIIIAETPEAFPSSTKMEIKPVLVPKSPPITKKLAETELDPFEVGIKPRSPSALRKNKISISAKDARSKKLKKPNVKIIGLVGQKLKNFNQCHEELESLYDKEGKRNLNFKDDEDPEDKIASDYEGEEVVKEEDKVEVKVNFVDLFCKKKVYSINENGIYNDGPNFKRFVKNGTSTTGTLSAPIPLLATKPREAIVVGGKTQPWLKPKRNKKVKKYKFTKPRKTKRKDEAVACEPADRLLLYSSGGSDESDAEEDDDDESEEEFEVNKRNVSYMQASNIKRNLEERSESEEEEVAELPNPLKRRRRQAGKNYNLMDSDDDDD